jgi:hypothetical protein
MKFYIKNVGIPGTGPIVTAIVTQTKACEDLGYWSYSGLMMYIYLE